MRSIFIKSTLFKEIIIFNLMKFLKDYFNVILKYAYEYNCTIVSIKNTNNRNINI